MIMRRRLVVPEIPKQKMKNKGDLFIDWVCGKSNYFPFFKNLPKVPQVEGFREETPDRLNPADDIFNQEGNSRDDR